MARVIVSNSVWYRIYEYYEYVKRFCANKYIIVIKFVEYVRLILIIIESIFAKKYAIIQKNVLLLQFERGN